MNTAKLSWDTLAPGQVPRRFAEGYLYRSAVLQLLERHGAPQLCTAGRVAAADSAALDHLFATVRTTEMLTRIVAALERAEAVCRAADAHNTP